MRRASQAGARLRRIEHQLADELAKIARVLGGGGDQLVEVGKAYRAVGS